MDQETLLRRIDSKLSVLIQAENKKAWGSARWVQQLTGWKGKDLELARMQGLIEFKRVDKSVLYNINSIPKNFLKS